MRTSSSSPPEVRFGEIRPTKKRISRSRPSNRARARRDQAILPKNVLCVEAQADVQDAFRKTLSRMGYRVFLVADPRARGERYTETTPDAVIFDLDGLGASVL